MRAAVRAVVGAVALALAVAPAAADRPCRDPIDEPIAVPWRDGGFDGARGACPVRDVEATVRGRALIDTPAFYGTLGGDLLLALRQPVGAAGEWGVAARVIDVAFVQNAVWKLVTPTVGPVLVHGTLGRDATVAGRPARGAVVAQLELPYTRDDLARWSTAAQVAAVATWAVTPRLVVHGRVGVLGWYARAAVGSSARGAALAAGDMAWRARRRLALSVGVDAQAGWYRDGLDHLAVRAGVGWRVHGCWRLAFAAGAPLAGAERQDAAVDLGVRRDLE